MDKQAVPPSLRHAIDSFTVFRNRVWLSGWVFDERPVAYLDFCAGGLKGGKRRIESYKKLASADVAKAMGPKASNVRFDEDFEVDPSQFLPAEAEIEVTYVDGMRTIIKGLGSSTGQRATALTGDFKQRIAARSTGALLEVGSRARSGITRRNLVPAGWSYSGLDVMAGPNVDVVGDAHELSKSFPAETFDAVMSFSVLEHLLMPWKFVAELNRVLRVGAVGLFTTHQCWPVHDQPWDFWRYSDKAWDALLNKGTGFRIIEASMGEPAFVVAQRCHPATDFRMQSAYLASNVLFEKISHVELSWPVSLDDAIATSYPAGEINHRE